MPVWVLYLITNRDLILLITENVLANNITVDCASALTAVFLVLQILYTDSVYSTHSIVCFLIELDSSIHTHTTVYVHRHLQKRIHIVYRAHSLGNECYLFAQWHATA